MVRKHCDKGAQVDGFKSNSRLGGGSCWSLLCHWWIIRCASCYEVPRNGKRSLYYLVPLKLMILKPFQYEFSTNGLLLEAITHASDQESGVGYCYQIYNMMDKTTLEEFAPSEKEICDLYDLSNSFHVGLKELLDLLLLISSHFYFFLTAHYFADDEFELESDVFDGNI
ncbi:hypothetical protein AKJ16_DCAP02093 [Drosera capensis]